MIVMKCEDCGKIHSGSDYPEGWWQSVVSKHGKKYDRYRLASYCSQCEKKLRPVSRLKENAMSEVKRYYATDVPVLWGDKSTGIVQEVVLASDYDALLAQARQLRNCLHNLTGGTGDGDRATIEEGREAVIDTADLEGGHNESK